MPARSRCLLFLAVAVLVAALVRREAGRGTFDGFEATYREWLAGNTIGPAPDPAVTFVRIRPPDEGNGAPVLDGWPPVALDYAVLLDNLADYAPPTTVLHDVPSWPADDPVGGPALVDQAGRFSRLVLGCLLEHQPTDPGIRSRPDDSWASPLSIRAEQVEGDPSAVPVFSGPLLLPPQSLHEIRGSRLGFTAIDLGTPPPPGTHPLIALAEDGSTFAASLVLQALAAASDTPLSEVRITLGGTARIGPLELPIDAGGRLPVPAWLGGSLHRIEADSLFLDAESANLAGSDELASLERLRGDLVILGSDSRSARTLDIGTGERVGPAELAALAITGARSGRLFRELPPIGQHLLWAGLAAAGALAMRHHRRRATAVVLLVALAYVVAVLLVFESLRVWWPLAVPASLLVLSLVAARLLPPPRPASGTGGKSAGPGPAALTAPGSDDS